MEFEWLPLTWGALATLITGLAAVGGAVFIGYKQTKILERQIEIQKEQSDNDRKLRSNDLKLTLLDKRANCISEMRLVYQILMEEGELKADAWTRLRSTIEDVELIFQANLIKNLSKVASSSIGAKFARTTQYRFHDEGHDEKAQVWCKRAEKHENFIFENFGDLIEALVDHSRLHDLA